MDPRLLKYYNTELRFLREMGGEFANRYPKIAARLGLDSFECADPYVERLLEGVSFLTARLQLKLDAEFPRFSQHLFELVYPHYLAPTPSMAIAQFQPDFDQASFEDGFSLPRDTVLRSVLDKGKRTACEFRTTKGIKLWPLQLLNAEYISSSSLLPTLDRTHLAKPKAGIRLRLKVTGDLTFEDLSLDELSLYLRGSDELSAKLFEQILGRGIAMVICPASKPESWQEIIDSEHINGEGFGDDESMLPYVPQSFSGYRLLHEYFAFPSRFMFVSLTGLNQAIKRCTESELDLYILLKQSEIELEDKVDASRFALYCTPAINLFPKRTDRIHLNKRDSEYHLVPDRSRPMDFEVFQVKSVTGFGTAGRESQKFHPFYSSSDPSFHSISQSYYTIYREQRLASSKQKLYGPRSSYSGSEVFLSLVDSQEAPYSPDLRQLAVETLCTNRDLPLHMPIGSETTDFTWELSAPIQAVRCISGPSKPQPSYAEGEIGWRLISHLSLNYLSLIDTDEKEGATALRELLGLYSFIKEVDLQKQIEGVLNVSSKSVYRRLPSPWPIVYGRGLEITVTIDESAFEGSGCFLLGAVLEQFFTRYASINSFTETVIRTLDRGEIMRWPVRVGQRQTI